MACNDCGDNSEDNVQLPIASNTTEPVPAVVVAPTTTTTIIKQVSCSTIKDECHSCPEIPNPFARIKLKNAFSMPACDQEAEILFDEDISNLMVGLTLYAVDSAQKTIRLKITQITPKNKLKVKNICSSCCGSTKPVGETIIAETYFSWGLPDCCSAGTSTGDSCLVGTFFFPVSGATSPANVPNSNLFVLGGLYSFGGFIWKVSARVNSTQVLFQNPAPGNGSTIGGYIDAGTEGACTYPITPISEASECDDAGVTAVSLIGCTSSGKRKLIGSRPCGIVKYNAGDSTFSVADLLGGSTVSGPHYVQWDKDNPCNSKLISAPTIAGSACGTITEPLFLTPANTSNQYDISVSNTGILSTSSPGNIVTLYGQQYQIVAIINAGAPGIVQLMPRFVVNSVQTIPPDSQMCVVTGCQPFPLSEYGIPGDINVYGEKVFCSSGGLRTAPRAKSLIEGVLISETNEITITAVGNHDRPVHTRQLINPSPNYEAVVRGRVEYVNQFTLRDTGAWRSETLFDFGIAPITVRDAFFARAQETVAESGDGTRIDVRMGVDFVLNLTAGYVSNFSFLPRVVTVNGASNVATWHSCIGNFNWHVTTK